MTPTADGGYAVRKRSTGICDGGCCWPTVAREKAANAVAGQAGTLGHVSLQQRPWQAGQLRDQQLVPAEQRAEGRIAFAGIWTSVLDDRLTDAERADMAAVRSHFRAATGFWAALTSDFKADDDSAYDAHLGEYWQAMADYVSILHGYGLHSGCAVAWPAPSTLTPPS